MPAYPKNFMEKGYSEYTPKSQMFNDLEDQLAITVDELASGILTKYNNPALASVSGSYIADGTINASKLATDSVTNLKIQAQAIGATKTDFYTTGQSGLSVGKFGPLKDANGVNVFLYISGYAVQISTT